MSSAKWQPYYLSLNVSRPGEAYMQLWIWFIDLGNGLVSVLAQAINWTNVELLSIRLLKTSVKFESKYTFFS